MSKEEQETNLPLHKQLQRSASLREKKDKLEERLRVSVTFLTLSQRFAETTEGKP